MVWKPIHLPGTVGLSLATLPPVHQDYSSATSELPRGLLWTCEPALDRTVNISSLAQDSTSSLFKIKKKHNKSCSQQFISSSKKGLETRRQLHSPDVSESYLCTPWKLWHSSYVCTCIHYTSQKGKPPRWQRRMSLERKPSNEKPATDPYLNKVLQNFGIVQTLWVPVPTRMILHFWGAMATETFTWDGSTPWVFPFLSICYLRFAAGFCPLFVYIYIL